MDRRSFVRAFGLGAGASVVPLAAVAVGVSGERKIPPPEGQARVTFLAGHPDPSAVSIAVGGDGYLWVKPGDREWARVATE